MKILLAGFEQETNSFSPVTTDESRFTSGPICGYGWDFVEKERGKQAAVAAFIDAIEAHGDTLIPVLNYFSVSGGPVERQVADRFITEVCRAYDAEKPDGLFFAFHSGMALTDHGDAVGFVLEQIRKHVGPEVLITMSSDLHANITPKIFANANYVAGYQTYPHEDYYGTGARAAKFAYMLFEKKPVYQAMLRLPMVIPAESYDTLRGPFADLVNEGHKCVDDGKILDFSFYMMQPWLNIEEGGTSVIVTASDKATAEKYVKYFADKLFALRKVLDVKLYTLDETIDAAIANDDGTPVILVDSADSQGAGSEADSTEVLRRLVERNFPVKAALHIHDEVAAAQAFEVGVGNEADFTLGGKYDTVFQRPYTVHAYVKSLFDGNWVLEGPAGKGNPYKSGKTAVLQIGNIDLIVFTWMGRNSDPQLYRAFGVEPTMNKLVLIKSASQYKVAYERFTKHFYPTDTPGASSANLKAMPFDKISHPFWPFDNVESYDGTFYYNRAY